AGKARCACRSDAGPGSGAGRVWGDDHGRWKHTWGNDNAVGSDLSVRSTGPGFTCVDAGGGFSRAGVRRSRLEQGAGPSPEKMSGGIEANFVKRFSDGPEIRVDASLACEQATVTVLFGPSGGGKTTALRCLAGLLIPEEGSVRFRGQTWSNA